MFVADPQGTQHVGYLRHDGRAGFRPKRVSPQQNGFTATLGRFRSDTQYTKRAMNSGPDDPQSERDPIRPLQPTTSYSTYHRGASTGSARVDNDTSPHGRADTYMPMVPVETTPHIEQAHMNHHERSPHCNPRSEPTPGCPHGPIKAARAPPGRHQVFV